MAGERRSDPHLERQHQPAGELKGYALLPGRGGRVSSLFICRIPLVWVQASTYFAGKGCGGMSALCSFSLKAWGSWVPLGFGCKRLGISEMIFCSVRSLQGTNLAWNLFSWLCLLEVLVWNLLQYRVWDIWGAIKKPRDPLCHSLSTKVPRRSTFPAPPFRVFLCLFGVLCPESFGWNRNNLGVMGLLHFGGKWKYKSFLLTFIVL